MFFSCPHCRDLVATDRETNLPPVMCPRCGGVLRDEKAGAKTRAEGASGGPSIASLLHGRAATPATEEEVDTSGQTQQSEADATHDAVETILPQDSVVDVAHDERVAIAADANETVAVVAGQAPTPELATQVPEPEALPPATQYLGPSFTRQRAQPATPVRAATWQWIALVSLGVILGIQVLLADRVRLATDANWRPLISSLCTAVGCTVPAWHQPGAFAMLSRDVSPIPGTAGGLNVQATFRNDARWPQAWPVLLLSLSDADGRVLGSRAFSPREYLDAAATQTELAPGQSAQIALKLHEPNPDVVAFSFDFR